VRKIIFHASRSTALSKTVSIGVVTRCRSNHRPPSHRLIANEIAAPILLPRRTMKKPHHKPKKKPLPTHRMPPGNKSTLQPAKSSGEQTELHAPNPTTR